MTTLDLRIKFKIDTGQNPTYGYGYDNGKYCNYTGGITDEYGEWLEGSRSSLKRMKYHMSTGNGSIYYDRYRNLRYTKGYKEWLEQLRCEAETIWEKLKN